MSKSVCDVCGIRHVSTPGNDGLGCLDVALAESERQRNKLCDMRGEIERIRRERNDWKAKAEGTERVRRPSTGDAPTDKETER